MTTVLSTTDYPAIRSLLNATADDITDSDMGSSGMIVFVNLLLGNYVPDMSVLSTADQNFAKVCGIYYAAAYLCPVMLIRFGESSKYKLGDYEEAFANPDWLAIETEFLLKARQAWYNLSILTHTNRTLFVTSGPTSSGITWPSSFNSFYFAIRPKVLAWAQNGGVLDNTIYNGSFV